MRRWLLLWALILGAWLAGPRAHAQDPTTATVPAARVASARDLVDDPALAAVLRPPPLPADYVVERRGPLAIAYPRSWQARVAGTVANAERDARAVAAQLGVTAIPTLEVRLVPDPDAMRALAPAAAPPPDYAVGVAYPAVRLALVSASAPRTWEASEVRQVLRHELSHLLLAEATGHAPVPRWLAEGIAVEQAGEHSFERFQELATASFTGRIAPLARLDHGFVEGPDAVNAAYAQAADFVAYLLRTEGAARFALLLAHVRGGASLDDAMRATYGGSLAFVEDEWRRDLDDRFAFAPLWAGTGVLWALGAVLLVVAVVRRRSKSRAMLARWAKEEEANRRVKLTVVTPGAWLPAAAPDGDVPTITVGDERHTLN